MNFNQEDLLMRILDRQAHINYHTFRVVGELLSNEDARIQRLCENISESATLLEELRNTFMPKSDPPAKIALADGSGGDTVTMR